MAITRAQLEVVLIRRCGKLLASVGLDGSTVTGSNPDLSDPIAQGLMAVGVTPSDPSNPTSTDLASVDPSMLTMLFDVADWRVYESILGNWTDPDQVAGQDNRQDLGKLRESVEKTAARKLDYLNRRYQLSLNPLGVGVIDPGGDTLDPDDAPDSTTAEY